MNELDIEKLQEEINDTMRLDAPPFFSMSDEEIIALHDKVINKTQIILYHGSESIVNPPVFGKGESANDYGLGFYMTEFPELAAEWACHGKNKIGIVNKYELNLNELRVLDMDKEPIEHWISVLVQNRDNKMSLGAREFMDSFIKKYPFSIKSYDIVKGWRADDSYYAFIRAFFSAALSLEKLQTAMRLGDYGNQYCLISEKSFKHIKYTDNNKVDGDLYYKKRCERDDKAKNDFINMQDKTRGKLIVDIVRE